MRHRKRFFSRILLILAGILLISLPARPCLAEAPFRLEESLVASVRVGASLKVALSGDIVVWEDYRYGNWDIFGYDLSRHLEFPVVIAPGSQLLPAVSGSIVVWQSRRDDTGDRWDIRGYDLVSGSEFLIATDLPIQAHPDISGNIVVWTQRGQTGWDIYGYNLETKVTSPLVTQLRDFPFFKISGTTLIYQVIEPKSIYGELIVYNLATKQQSSFGRAQAAKCDVSGDLVAWLEAPLGRHFALYAFATAKNERQTLAENPHLVTGPFVSDNVVVWTESFEPEGTSLHGVDLDGKVGFSLPTSWRSQAMSGNRIAGIRVSTTTERPGYRTDIIVAKVIRLADFPIPNGHFFTQTNGRPLGTGSLGFAVTNAEDILFWDTWQQSGLENIGYPISQRFMWKGFLTQAFQKAAFQWQPGKGIFFINVFDELHDAGFDPWLLAFRSTPPQLDPSFDAGKTWEQIVQDRLALLDADPGVKARYFAAPDPLLLFGLPTSQVRDLGNVVAIRTQRAVIQRWKVDVPWARAGEVTVANGGDIARELGLFPAEVLVPQPPP